MQIAKDTVVSIHYTLKDDAGKVLDSSDGGEPLAYIHGNGNLIPGLESQLEGKAKGAKLEVKDLGVRGHTRKIALQGRSSKDTRVAEIMTRDVLYVSPQTTTHQCMALMSDKRARHLPVVDHKKVIGLVSIGDLVKATIAEQQFIIEQLEHYISGQ